MLLTNKIFTVLASSLSLLVSLASSHPGYPIAERGYPIAERGYPIAERGYPIAERGYPIAERGYPIAERGYPIAERGYPIAERGYPIAERGYPIAERGYPIAERGYPIAERGYPIAERGYPIAERGYPIAERGYPIAERGYPIAGRGYPIAERAQGDKASAVFSVLAGTINFVQDGPTDVTASGFFTQGITDTNPDNYAMELLGSSKTFTELGIKIKVPGTEPYSKSATAVMEAIKGQTLSVLHNGSVIDSAVIN